jgi:hypothetical protein
MGNFTGLYEEDCLCFHALTPIQISLAQTKPITDIRIGDMVLAFDPAADLARR